MTEQRFRILFVDDEEAILKSLRRLMRRHSYDCWFATSGAEGLTILEAQSIDLVISDMRMPEMDGATFLKEVKQRWPFSVRFLLTGYADMSATIDALNLGGINRYVSKPWDDGALIEAIEEGLRIRRLEKQKKKLIDRTREQNRELQELNAELEQRVSSRTREVQQKSVDLQKAFRQLEKSYESFVRVFASVIANRPHLVKGQSAEVAELARRVATSMKMEAVQIRYVYYAALLHEVGKLSLSDDVLSRSEVQLTHRDLPEYRRYPELGEMTLMPIKALRPCAELIRHHTEYVDGSGYPDGLVGHDIPLGARIIRAVRDFIGLQTTLLREKPLSPKAAFENIRERSDHHYDPEVLLALEPLAQNFTMAHEPRNAQLLAIHELYPGMVLERDLVNHKGILLMVRGTELTDSSIQRLKRMASEDKQHLKASVVHDATSKTDNEEQQA